MILQVVMATNRSTLGWIKQVANPLVSWLYVRHQSLNEPDRQGDSFGTPPFQVPCCRALWSRFEFNIQGKGGTPLTENHKRPPSVSLNKSHNKAIFPGEGGISGMPLKLQWWIWKKWHSSQWRKTWHTWNMSTGFAETTPKNIGLKPETITKKQYLSIFRVDLPI